MKFHRGEYVSLDFRNDANRELSMYLGKRFKVLHYTDNELVQSAEVFVNALGYLEQIRTLKTRYPDNRLWVQDEKQMYCFWEKRLIRSPRVNMPLEDL